MTSPLVEYLVFPLITALLIMLYGFVASKIMGISLNSQMYYLLFVVGLISAILRLLFQMFLISRFNLSSCAD